MKILFCILSRILFLLKKIGYVLIGQLKIAKITGLYNFSKENNFILKVFDSNVERKFKKPYESINDYVNQVNDEWINLTTSKVYLSCIKNAYVFSQVDGFYLKDSKEFVYERADWDKSCFRFYEYPIIKMNSSKAYLLFSTRKCLEIEKAISLVKMWSSNIFHFTFEVMACLQGIENNIEYDDWPLLIDDCILNDKRSLEFLNIMNKKNRKIIFVKKNKPVFVKKLLILPRYAWAFWSKDLLDYGIGWNIADTAVDFIRSSVLTTNLERKKHDKIFVIRGNDKRLINESKLIQKFIELGFEIFNPDNASFSEEVDFFSNANVIVLCSGGAATNLVYTNSKAKIFVISPFERQETSNYKMFKCDYKILLADIVKNGNTLNTSTFYLDEKKLNIFRDELC